MEDLEPDLLLAIQLSLQESEAAVPESENVDSAQNEPDSVTEAPVEDPISKKQDELIEQQTEYFKSVIKFLQSDDVFTTATEIEKCFLPLLGFLESEDSKIFSSLESFEFLVNVLEVLLLSLYDSSKFYEIFAEADQRTFFRRLYRSSQYFCVRGLEAITTARTETECKAEELEVNPCSKIDPVKLKELRITIIGILSNCCVTDKLPTKTNLTRKKNALSSLAIPTMEPVLTKPTETVVEITPPEEEYNIANVMLNIKPITQSSGESEKTEKPADTIDRSTLMKLNISSLDKNVNGIVRLLNICQNLVTADAELISESDVKFIISVVEFLGARGFNHYSSSEKDKQAHAAAAVSFTIALSANHNASPFIDNVVFEHSFIMIQQLGCVSLSFNVQCLVAKQILKEIVNTDLLASLLEPKIQCIKEYNFPLLHLAFEVYKNVLVDNVTLEPVLVCGPTITETCIIDGFNCFASASIPDLASYLLEVPLLDIAFSTMLASYKLECIASVFDSPTENVSEASAAPPSPPTSGPPPPPAAPKSIKSNNTSKKSVSSKKKTSNKSRTSSKKSKKEEIVKSCTNNRDFFNKVSALIVQLFQGDTESVRTLIRSTLTSQHLDVFLLIAKYQSTCTLHDITNGEKLVTKTGPILAIPIASQTLNTIAFSMTSNNLLTDDNINYILQVTGCKDLWPLFIPCEQLTIISRLVLTQCQMKPALPSEIWMNVIAALSAALSAAYSECIHEDILGPDHVQFLLIIFYMQSNDQKQKSFTQLLDLIQGECTEKPRNTLALSRLLLITNHLMYHYTTASRAILESFKDFLAGKVSVYSVYKQLKPDELVNRPLPTLYCLPSCEPAKLKLDLFPREVVASYKTSFHRLFQVSSSDPSVGNNVTLYEYYFRMSWDFIKSLPNKLSNESLSIPQEIDNLLVQYLFSLMKYSFDKATEKKEADVQLLQHLTACCTMLGKVSSDMLNVDQYLALPLARALVTVLEIAFTSVKAILCNSIGADYDSLVYFFKDAPEDSLGQKYAKISLEFLQTHYQELFSIILSCFKNVSEIFNSQRKKALCEKQDIKESWKLIEALQSGLVSEEELRASLEGYISDTSTLLVIKWNTRSNGTHISVDSSVPSARLEHVIVDSISARDDPVDGLFHFIQSLLDLCGSTLGIIREKLDTDQEKPSLVESQSQEIIDCFFDLAYDTPFLNIKSCTSVLNNNFKSTQVATTATNYQLVRASKFICALSDLADSSISISKCSTIINTVVLSILGALNDHSDLLTRESLAELPVSALWRLFMLYTDESINNSLTQFFTKILEPSENIVLTEMRNKVLLLLETENPKNLVKWIRLHLLGCNSGEKQVVAGQSTVNNSIKVITLIMANSRAKLENCLIDICLSLFDDAFEHWISNIDPFFLILKNLCWQNNRVSDLVEKILLLLLNEVIISGVGSSEAHMKCELLFVQFLNESVKIAGPKFSPSSLLTSAELPNPTVNEDDGDFSQKLCTYTVTEDNFEEQHWYYCYTCNMTFNEGVCSVCVKVCHKDHDVSYARYSRFFCDCGAAAVRGLKCKALQPRESSSKLPEKPDLQIVPSSKESLGNYLKDGKFGSNLIGIYQKLFALLQTHKPVEQANNQPQFKISINEKTITNKSDIIGFKRGLKPTFRVKYKFDGVHGREMKKLAQKKCINRKLIDIGSNGLMAIAEQHSVTIGTCPKLFDSSKGVLGKSNFKPASNNSVAFHTLYLAFNPSNANYIAVAGLKDCVIITADDTGKASDQLAVDLSLEALSDDIYIIDIVWIPGSQVNLAVVTNQFVKIFDLSKDTICPVHYFSLLEDRVVDISFKHNTETGQVTMILLATSGMLFAKNFGDSDSGPCILTDVVTIDDCLCGKGGYSVHYSSNLDITIVGYEDGKTFAGRLNPELTGFIWTFSINQPAAEDSYHSWTDVPSSPGAIVCRSKKDSVVAMLFEEDNLFVQVLPLCSKVEGIAFVPKILSGTGDSMILAIVDDGSLHRMNFQPSKEEEGESSSQEEISEVGEAKITMEELRKLTSLNKERLLSIFKKDKKDGLLQKLRRSANVAKKEKEASGFTFPIDFFEKVEPITDSVSLAGDILVCYSAEDAKAQLASNSGYIAIPNSNRFEIIIGNTLPNMLIAGIRILVGHTSTKHTPRSITVFDRTIECKEDTRRWYEFPFTARQSQQAKDQVSLVAEGSFDESANSIVIDSMEVYGLAREKFDWKEEIASSPSSTQQVSSVLEKTLLICSDTLSNYFKNFPPSEELTQYRELVALLPTLLKQSEYNALYCSLQNLLASLNTKASDYHSLKDAVELSFIAESLSNTEASAIPVEVFERYVDTMNTVASLREENLFQFLENYQKFPNVFVKQFWNINKHHKWCSLDTVVTGIIHFIFGFINYLKKCSPSSSGVASLLPAFSLVKEFIFTSDNVIRITAVNAITGFYTKDIVLPTVNENKLAGVFVSGYNCDGCMQEITGFRWNCNVCDDFDLCDECHEERTEFLDSEHSTDHEMKRFPEEDTEPDSEVKQGNVYELFGSDSPSQSRRGDNPAGVDPDDEETLLAMALAMSMENSEPSESSCSAQDAFFTWLLDEFNNAKVYGGTEALPLATLLYSVVLHKNSDDWLNTKISKLTKEMVTPSLDECVVERSAKLEVNILVLKFFAALIRDPRGKNPPASRVLVATPESAEITILLLKETNLLEKIFNIASTLFPLLQESQESVENSCGALLKPNAPTITEGIFPFFSKGYVKKNPDLFNDHKKLLIESALKLAALLFKHTSKNGEGTEEANEKWIPVLCNYINSPRTAFISTKAKSLLLAVCKSKTKYYLVRDFAQYSQAEKEIQELNDKSSQFKNDLSYNDTVKLMRCLNTIWSSASTRPTNWQKFIAEHTSLMCLFFNACFYFIEGPKCLAMKLLAYCFLPKTLLADIIEAKQTKKTEAATTGTCTKLPTTVLDTLFTKDSISRFLNVFLLEYNNKSIREEARNIFHWMWFQASQQLKDLIFSILCSKIPMIPAYGRNSAEFFELLSFVIGDLDSSKVSPSVFQSLLETLQQQNTLLSNHPNSYLYQTLSSLVNFDGYYLESEPCLVCNDPEVPYQQKKLNSLQTESKFTGNTYINKFKDSYTIQQITVNISDISKSRMIKTINLYYNNKAVQDIAELRDQWKMWKKVKSCELAPSQRKLVVDFLVPITATNFLVEFADFHEDLQMKAMEKLTCPRCNQIVTDKHGLCNNCRENAFQCRQCRNINYENLNAFLCNECGYSKYANFSISARAKPSFACDRISNDEERDTAMELVDKESENAYYCYSQIMDHKKPISELILRIKSDTTIDDHSTETLVNSNISQLATLYGEDCKRSFASLSKSMQILLGTRRELVAYNQRKSSRPDIVDAQIRPTNQCFGCANAFISLSLALVDNLSQIPQIRKLLVSCKVLQELISTNMLQGTSANRAETRKVICSLVKDDNNATKVLNSLLWKKFDYVLHNYLRVDIAGFIKNEIQLLIEAAAIQDSCWESRLQLLMKLFFSATQYDNNPAIVNQIILPCLRHISKITEFSLPTNDDENTKSQFEVSPPEGHPTACYATWCEQLHYNDWKQSAKISYFGPERKDDKETKKIDLSVMRKVITKWKLIAGIDSSSSLQLSDGWITNLLFCRNSVSIREESVKLIQNLSSSETRKRALLTLLESKLPTAIASGGDAAKEYFKLFESMVEKTEAKVYLTLRGFLKTITDLILREIERIQSLEKTFTSDISQGFVLQTYVSLLASFLEVPGIRRKFKEDQLMITLLDGFLSVRGIIVQKTKLTDDSATQLISLLKSLHGDNEQDNQLFMVACIKALDKHSTGRTPIFIFEQLCNIVCPTKPEPEYLMSLNKSPTQEEFIRGSMNRNPYSSKEAGPLMRDVKNKICRDLDLRGLLEDDNSMELLICNQIIKLDLSVKQVFEQVWMKGMNISKPDDAPPMDILYRLQGLDGDATEEFVENLPAENDDEVDPEEQYAITSVMSECGGLEAMIEQINSINNFDMEKELAHQVLKLLLHCCKIKVNRQKLLQMNSVGVLLEKLKLAFPRESQADIAELLLLIIESIVSEANITDEQTPDIEGLSDTQIEQNQLEEAKSQMSMFLEKLGSPLVRCNPRIVKSVTRVLPVLTYGQEPIAEILGLFFVPFLNFEDFDSIEFEDVDLVFHLDCFVSVTTSIRLDSNGMKLRDVFEKLGITDRLFNHLTTLMPKPEQSEDEEAWQKFTEHSSLVYVLQSLAGLVKGHASTQAKAIEHKIIPGLYQLSGMSTQNKLGNFAENLLDALALNNPTVTQAIQDVKSSIEEQKKEIAKAARQRILDQMNMQAEPSVRGNNQNTCIIHAGALENFDFEDLEDEVFSCKVCREGYVYMPTEILGFYVYVKKVSLGGSRKDAVYSSVTNFNIIHTSCHTKAAAADAELKPRKEEWDGAMLRNSSTYCNNIFPIRGPEVSEEVYAAQVDNYWSTAASTCGRCESTRFRTLSHDFKLLLLRYATEASFSEDSRGGGRESNICMIPFFVQMGLYLLDTTGSAQRHAFEQTLSQFLSHDKNLWIKDSGKIDNSLFACVISLFLQSKEEWNRWKLYFLERVLFQSFVDNTGEEKGQPSVDRLFEISKSSLTFLCMVDKFHNRLKISSSVPVPSDPATISHSSEVDWIVALNKAILQTPADVIDTSKQILKEYEDSLLSFDSFSLFYKSLDLLDKVEKPNEHVLQLYLQFSESQ